VTWHARFNVQSWMLSTTFTTRNHLSGVMMPTLCISTEQPALHALQQSIYGAITALTNLEKNTILRCCYAQCPGKSQSTSAQIKSTNWMHSVTPANSHIYRRPLDHRPHKPHKLAAITAAIKGMEVQQWLPACSNLSSTGKACVESTAPVDACRMHNAQCIVLNTPSQGRVQYTLR